MALPCIVSTPGTCGGRPRIDGSRIRVQDVATLHEAHGMSPDEILQAYPHLSLAEVHTALAYYYAHQDEIRRHVEEDEAFVEHMRSAGAAHE